jgi:hypothetical protein
MSKILVARAADLANAFNQALNHGRQFLSEARPNRLPMRSVERVRTWRIFTHERLGNLAS